MLKRMILLAGLFVLTASGAYADGVTYDVTVDTSTISGTSGALDFQFDPGLFTSQNATLAISDFSTDGALGAAFTTGDVTGTLPGDLDFDNLTSFNDYFTNFTYGDTISFDVTLSGPAVTSPDGVSQSGSSFFFSMYDDNGNPLLTSAPFGTAVELDINLDGSTSAIISSSQATAESSTTPVPEPGTSLLVACGLILLIGRKKARLTSVE